MDNEPLFVPLKYQNQNWQAPFSTQTSAPDFSTRRNDFFAQVFCNNICFRASKRAMLEVACLAAGEQPDKNIIHTAITDFLEARQDCADFVLQTVLRVLNQFNENAERAFSSERFFHARSLENRKANSS